MKCKKHGLSQCAECRDAPFIDSMDALTMFKEGEIGKEQALAIIEANRDKVRQRFNEAVLKQLNVIRDMVFGSPEN